MTSRSEQNNGKRKADDSSRRASKKQGQAIPLHTMKSRAINIIFRSSVSGFSFKYQKRFDQLVTLIGSKIKRLAEGE